jgi:hypothetical protein
MEKWIKVAEELEAQRIAGRRAPNAMAPDTVRQFAGPVIVGRARPPLSKVALPPPTGETIQQPGKRFAENGHLLDSQESFLKVGRKGKW